MFALRAGRRDGGFVLPRMMRRPARFVSRFVAGEVEAPPFLMLALSAALIGGFSAYGMVAGGHTSTVVQAVTARTGFAIEEIRVVGNVETSDVDIFDRVGLDGYTSLIGFDAEGARKRIETLPWIQSAEVRKVYPATLEVAVTERKPFAIWQRGSLLSLIEEDGKVIAPLAGTRHLTLPLVVGSGAAEEAKAFISQVAQVPGLAQRVRGYVRVSERRWDLRFDNGLTVKLPENGVDVALRDLIELDQQHGLLARDVQIVDMRFPDRLVVKLSPDAATAREAVMKERLGKHYRPAERRV